MTHGINLCWMPAKVMYPQAQPSVLLVDSFNFNFVDEERLDKNHKKWYYYILKVDSFWIKC